MLYADAVRGWDATGVIGVTREGNVDVKKQAVPASSFVSSDKFSAFKGKIISQFHIAIGHNRKATHGEKRSVDSHPFWDKENKIFLVHNGMISNHKEFCKDSTVDSAAITNAIAEKGPKEILPQLTGAYALIWYDVAQKKVCFARNEARPLYIVETDDLFALMSEPTLATWVLSRNNQKVISIKQVEDHKLYTYNLDSRTISLEFEYEQKKPVITTTYTAQNQNGIGRVKPYLLLPNVIQQHQGIVLPLQKVKQPPLPWELVDLDKSCFLSTNDLKTVDDVRAAYQINTTIYINISTYKENINTKTGDITYTVIGRPINVNHNWIICKNVISKTEFDLLDLTEVYEFEIKAIHFLADKNVIWLSGTIGNEVSYVECNNGTVITESMWFDSVFPDTCDSCKSKLTYRTLGQSDIELEGCEIKHAICPSCTEKYRNM